MPFVAHGRDLGAKSAGHEGNNGDHAAEREERVINALARLGDHRVAGQLNRLEPGFDLSQFLVGQSRQEVIVHGCPPPYTRNYASAGQLTMQCRLQTTTHPWGTNGARSRDGGEDSYEPSCP